jgi:hypothetical protein
MIFILLYLPCFVFAQSNIDDYAVYSSYFRMFNDTRGGKHTFVVQVSTNYGRKEGESDIISVLDDFREYVKNKKVGDAFFKNFFLIDTLKKDTLWLPLISKLIQRMHKPHVIQNRFSKDLDVFLLPYTEYIKYFGESGSSIKGIDDAWASFHENYPDHGILTDLSEIVNDGKRAVFYFGWRCGGLCGDGSLVMFYKEGLEWKFVTAIPMWYN